MPKDENVPVTLSDEEARIIKIAGRCKVCHIPVMLVDILGADPKSDDPVLKFGKVLHHESFGFACRHHEGVLDHFLKLLK